MNTRLMFAVAVVIGLSGCASQGGGKLGHSEVMAAQQLNDETIQVCSQTGAVMTCQTEDREQVRRELEYRLQSLNYQR